MLELSWLHGVLTGVQVLLKGLEEGWACITA